MKKKSTLISLNELGNVRVWKKESTSPFDLKVCDGVDFCQALESISLMILLKEMAYICVCSGQIWWKRIYSRPNKINK